MTPLDELFNKPAGKFKGKDAVEWIPFVYQLALRSLPLRDIAAKLECHPNTVKDYPDLIAAINKGHADHRLTVEHELFSDATANPYDFDVEERSSVRVARSQAIKILKNSIEKKAEFFSPLDIERIKRLSDAELQEELKKHLEKK